MEDFQSTLIKGLGNASAAAKKVYIEAGATPERLQFLERIQQLPKETAQGLIEGRLQAEDVMLFGFKEVAAVQRVEIFKSDDDVKVGLCNVDGAKLDKPVLLQAIQIEYSEAAAGTFVPTALIAAARSGDLQLTIDGKEIMKTGMHIFLRPDEYTVESKSLALIYKLKTPKWLPENKRIGLNIDFTSALPAPGSGLLHGFRASLFGIGVNSNVVQ